MASNSRGTDLGRLSAAERRLKSRLDRLVATSDRLAHRAEDPVEFVHQYESKTDRELVGVIAALLAFGNVVAVRRSVRRVLDNLGSHPAETLRHASKRDLRRRLHGFVHRIYRSEHLVQLLWRAREVMDEEGSLGALFEKSMKEGCSYRAALAVFAERLRGERADRSMRHLVPSPEAGSACKRLVLYTRWMVRPADGVDLGLWNVPAADLVIPLDTHVHRISRNLGLTARATATWRTAEEITARLRRLDPTDPVKYDFAICHLGVSRQCPSRRDEELCRRCVLKSVCEQYAAGRSVG